MKRLLSVILILFAFSGLGWSQGSVTLNATLDPATPVFTDPYITEGNLINVDLIKFDLISSVDVAVTNIQFNMATEWPTIYGKPTLTNIGLYNDNGVLLTSCTQLIDDQCNFVLRSNLIAGRVNKFTVKADIADVGKITPWIGTIKYIELATFNSVVIYPNIMGNYLRLINPGGTAVELLSYPYLLTDTCFIYPGQFWSLQNRIVTSSKNFLPEVIQGIYAQWYVNWIAGTKTFSFDDHYFNWQMAGYYDESGFNLPAGYLYQQVGDNSALLKWYSNGKGISAYDGYNCWGWSGTKQLQVGDCLQFCQSQFVVLYTSQFIGGPREQSLYNYTLLKCIDALRCDVNKDGKVDYDDLAIISQGMTNPDLQLYNNQQIDFGRSIILFDVPGNFIDSWLLNRWLANHNDPLVRDLGIGQLMSQRVVQPQTATVTTNLSGNNLVINTTGQAVMVSTMLPNGKIWTKDAWVVNGMVNVTIPDPNLHYRIQSVVLNGLTGVNDNETIPTEFKLSQNYPNPFNPTTIINFSLPKESHVTIKVYDILGKEITTLVNETKTAGEHSVNFNGSNLASGTYIYKLTAGSYTSVKKMMLMK